MIYRMAPIPTSLILTFVVFYLLQAFSNANSRLVLQQSTRCQLESRASRGPSETVGLLVTSKVSGLVRRRCGLYSPKDIQENGRSDKIYWFVEANSEA